MLEAFPTAGKVDHSERFMLNDFLGHEFLHSAYVADYKLDGQNFQLFVMCAASEAAARVMLERYAALDKGGPGPGVRPGTRTIDDPYNGPILVSWQGQYICGSTGRGEAAAKALALLAGKLAGK
jgi:hypothetical protein